MLSASDGWGIASGAIDHFTGSAWGPVTDPTANFLNGIHMVFVLSTLLLALSDRIGESKDNGH